METNETTLHNRQGQVTKNIEEPIELNPKFDTLESPKTFISHLQDLKTQNRGLFKIKTANEWLEQAKTTPIPAMLFGEFWHENELCILFADSNLGKSILAVQIANSISKGKQIQGFKMEAQKQPILYFDFELSAKQFEVRYSVKIQDQKHLKTIFHLMIISKE